MSTTGLDVFDTTLQTTNLWLKEIAEDIGPDRRRAYHALAAVLRALRDRLTIDEAAQLSAQLPLLVRGIYFDQWRPAEQPKRARHVEDLLEAIAAGEGQITPINPERMPSGRHAMTSASSKANEFARVNPERLSEASEDRHGGRCRSGLDPADIARA